MARAFAHKTLRILEPVDRERASVVAHRKALAGKVGTFLERARGPMLRPLLAAYEPPKAGAGPDGRKMSDRELEAEVRRLLGLLDEEVWKDLPAQVRGTLEAIAKDGGMAGLVQVGAEDVADLLELVNERAVAWAGERAAELVGMKWVDGNLVPNPNAEWAIPDSTREAIRQDVTTAMREGWSNQRLANELRDSEGFSKARADMIARTETAYADASANNAAWRESGLVGGHIWLVANNGNECPICEANGAQGEIPLEDPFESGDMEEPQHVNCNCVTSAVLKEGA